MTDLGPPFISIPNLHNFRAVGGFTVPSSSSSSSSTVRSDLLYRSADPSKLALDGLAQLHALGIRTIFDLRSKPEIERQGGSEEFEARLEEFNKGLRENNRVDRRYKANGGTGLKRVWTPVFAEEDYSPEKIAIRYREYAKEGTEGFIHAYASILTHGAPSFALILRHLASPSSSSSSSPSSPDDGTLIHCTAGKDRTGVLIAVILSLLRVPPAAIAAEYALTERGLREARPRIGTGIVAHIVAHFVEEGMEEEEAREAARRMGGAKEESVLGMLEMVRGRWGGVEGYLAECCGVGEEVVRGLRGRFLV